MEDWFAPAVLVAVAAVAVTIVLGVLSLWHRSRQARLNADREVLDRILADADEYFEEMLRFESLVVTGARSSAVTVAAIRDAASTLQKLWTALERAVFQVGRLSTVRYDGVRPLGRRIHDACTSTASDRAFLEVLATGSAYTDPSKLSSAIPWPDLQTDALLYRTLAVVYRRRGPLTPRRLTWWRIPSRRESTSLQIAAPLRRKRRRRGTNEERVTSVEQTRTLIGDTPGLEGLSDSEVNALAYRVLHGYAEGETSAESED